MLRDISKKFIIDNKGVITVRSFEKLAANIEKAFKVDMVLVESNSQQYVELFKKWYKDPIYAVFHDSKFMNGRYKIVMDGPAIYFFKGVNKWGMMELTSYTVQHELYHLKLWYKMTRETPELAPLYKKIPRWLHEEDVIGQFMKQPEKWNMEDIMNDINVYNNRYLPSNQKPRTLQYFKDWKLGDHLKNLP